MVLSVPVCIHKMVSFILYCVMLVGSIYILYNREYFSMVSFICTIVSVSLYTTVIAKGQVDIVGGYFQVDTAVMYFILLSVYIMQVIDLNAPTTSERFIGHLVVALCMLAFSSTSLYHFFVFFELSLVAIVLFMLMNENLEPQSSLTRAVLYMLMYATFGSVFLLAGLVSLNGIVGSLYNVAIGYANVSHEYVWLLLAVAFGVKVPLIGLHLWLGEAHVEASAIGSLLLAGLLLKLGTFAFYRYNVLLL